jgi:GH18 family chitinase
MVVFAGLILEPPAAASETQNYATGEVGLLGNLNRGSFTATHAEDGAYEKITEIMPPVVDNTYLTEDQGGPLVFMRNPDDPAEESRVDLMADGATAMDMLDYVHVMNFDMVGASWEDTTRHHAPLYGYEGPAGDPAAVDPDKDYLTKYNSHYAIQAYRFVHEDYSNFEADSPGLDPMAGVAQIPAAKLTFGVPMYGRGFKSVDPGVWDEYAGLFQFTDASSRRRTPKGTWDGGQWGNSGVFAYWDVLLNHGGDGDQPGNDIWRVTTPTTARPYGPYTLDGDLFIGFDDPASIAGKMNYLVGNGMAGVMFWDFAGDLSEAQLEQGVAGADAAYPAKSLIHHLTNTLEALYSSP